MIHGAHAARAKAHEVDLRVLTRQHAEVDAADKLRVGEGAHALAPVPTRRMIYSFFLSKLIMSATSENSENCAQELSRVKYEISMYYCIF